MSVRHSFVLLVVSLASMCRASEVLELRVVETIPVAGRQGSAIATPVKCDSTRNLYFRALSGPAHARPVIRISPDGSKTHDFSIPQRPEYKGAQIRDFAVDDYGRVYLLVSRGRTGDIVVFDRNGDLERVVSLEPEMYVRQLAVLPESQFVVFGQRPFNEPGESIYDAEPIAAIFDFRGRLKLELGKVEHYHPEKGDRSAPPKQELALYFMWTQLLADPDGNWYLMRYSPEGPIQVYTPSGDLIRSHRVRADGEATLETFRLSSGQIAAMFVGKKKSSEDTPPGSLATVKIQVMDGTTGDIVQEYSTWLTSLACFAPGEFTFLATRRGQLEIIRMRP
jgi:hypothetical protein